MSHYLSILLQGMSVRIVLAIAFVGILYYSTLDPPDDDPPDDDPPDDDPPDDDPPDDDPPDDVYLYRYNESWGCAEELPAGATELGKMTPEACHYSIINRDGDSRIGWWRCQNNECKHTTEMTSVYDPMYHATQSDCYANSTCEIPHEPSEVHLYRLGDSWGCAELVPDGADDLGVFTPSECDRTLLNRDGDPPVGWWRCGENGVCGYTTDHVSTMDPVYNATPESCFTQCASQGWYIGSGGCQSTDSCYVAGGHMATDTSEPCYATDCPYIIQYRVDSAGNATGESRCVAHPGGVMTQEQCTELSNFTMFSPDTAILVFRSLLDTATETSGSGYFADQGSMSELWGIFSTVLSDIGLSMSVFGPSPGSINLDTVPESQRKRALINYAQSKWDMYTYQ